MRSRQALPTDIPHLTAAPTANSNHQQLTNSVHRAPSGTNMSEMTSEVQKIIEERTAHAETMNALQSCDELVRFYS